MMLVRAICGLAAGVSLTAALATDLRAQESEQLQPFQMVRSLELVQDRIAGGDHAALPMQRKLLEMIDARFAADDYTRFDNVLNRHALLVYAMSGGNPTTVEAALTRLGKDDPVVKLGAGILAYIKGEPMAAQTAMKAMDPTAYAPDIGAYLALVKGSVLAEDEPEVAVAMLDRARLLSPGTLVEEAALRRSIAIAAAIGDTGRFLKASEQYVRGYLRSPYASQFADNFVAGVVTLHAAIDLDAVSAIASLMDPEQEKVIYLRIARHAAIDGLIDLSAFASARAEGKTEDPRTMLYSSLSSVTSGSVIDVLDKLSEIDRSSLSANDRQLLDAASAIATEVAAVPAGMPARKAVPTTRSVGPKPAIEPDAPAGPEAPAATSRAALEAPAAKPDTTNIKPTVAAKSIDAAADQADALMTEARAKLSDIDKLLGEMPE